MVRAGDEALTGGQMADEAATLRAAMGESGGGGLLGRLSGVARVGAAMALPVAGPAMAGKTPWPRPIENGARPRWMPRGTAGTRSKALRGERMRRDQEPTSPSGLATAPVPPVSTSTAQPRIRRAHCPN